MLPPVSRLASSRNGRSIRFLRVGLKPYFEDECMLKIALGIACSMTLVSSFAQVYQCPDKATGLTSFSDKPCAGGHQIVKERTPEEQAISAERAALARERSQLERERAALRELQQAQPQSPPPASPAGQPIDLHACRTAKRELSIASNMQSESEAGKRRRMNAAIIEVNSACGTKTELIQEPAVHHFGSKR
ncbi:MAG TPA: hypothetical protein VIN35_10720 [Hydrogenophaga sp.]